MLKAINLIQLCIQLKTKLLLMLNFILILYNLIDNLNTLCVRKTPPEFGPNRSFSVFPKHNYLQINAFILSKNLHNPEVPGSNPGLAT